MAEAQKLPDSQRINFTDAAALKVKHLIDEEGNPKLNLRVFIAGGGCSGFQYGFTFDETINADDIIINKIVYEKQSGNDATSKSDDPNEDDEGGGDDGSSVKLLIDSMSFQYLQGADIDYREDVNGEQFVIRNPNAKTTCGCGSSFSV